ncbi:helix-turn-helix domain-containing protein [Gammaproteobacteria bacterium]|nr:helix-turn-helix domain-containing protein [Gammaproteobacteria bacterium]
MSTARTTEGSQALAAHVKQAFDRYVETLEGEDPKNLHAIVIGEAERALIESVMEFVDGNQSRAARILGINRNTLRSKLD